MLTLFLCVSQNVSLRSFYIPLYKTEHMRQNWSKVKNNLRVIQSQSFEKIKNIQPELKFTGSY